MVETRFNSQRGRNWFEALTGKSVDDLQKAVKPESVLFSDEELGGEPVRYLCIVPNSSARFPCASDGEVGLEEAFALSSYVNEWIEKNNSGKRSPIIAIVDVKSQAYGRREETAAIYHAAACAADAYATARTLGHPIVTLVVGQALSGGFLTHGYQANRILALNDAGVVIHAMHKEAAARVTKRTVAELDELAKTVTPISYSISDFAKLGILHELLNVENAEKPTASDVESVRAKLLEAIDDVRRGGSDLSIRWRSSAAAVSRKATLAVRAAMEEQWNKN